MTAPAAHRIRPGRIPVRDTSLYVDVTGHGYPLLLMHGGPGADHWTLLPFRQLADQFTLIFYDHRCNGRSHGAPVSSMTFENLTADADALRRRLGYERWAVLGHSFGGHVALEYALRYPGRLSHLVLVDTGGDSRWSRRNAAEVLASRGYRPEKVELVRRFFNGEFPPRQMPLILMRIGSAYYSRPSLSLVTRELIRGEWRSKMRPDAMIFAGRHLLKDWTVPECSYPGWALRRQASRPGLGGAAIILDRSAQPEAAHPGRPARPAPPGPLHAASTADSATVSAASSSADGWPATTSSTGPPACCAAWPFPVMGGRCRCRTAAGPAPRTRPAAIPSPPGRSAATGRVPSPHPPAVPCR